MTHHELIDSLIKGGYLRTSRLIEAFKKIDRADFVPEDLKHEAYVNAPLPIGLGQTISQPLTVAFMLELLAPEPGNIILDVGSGSAWQASLLAQIVGEKGKIFAIEIVDSLFELGKKNAEKYQFVSRGRIEFVKANGALGLPQRAPFDRIIAGASGQIIPGAWKEQVKINGRIVTPVKSSVWLLAKKAENKFEEFEYPGFAFVPLVKDEEEGKGHWKKYFEKRDD